jgi:sugar/nucleoside kinase (ribokinase family)
MVEGFDILGLGCTAVDDLIYVEGYPAADSKVRIRRQERQAGGLTGTALVAAARMGARCQYAGGLGGDEFSRFVQQRLQEEGVGLEHLDRRDDPRPAHSLIVVDESRQTRTIFCDSDGAARARVDWPPDDVIRAARVLFVDHFGIEGMIRAARVARAAGIAVVADFESAAEDERFAELVALADHPVTPLAFARRWTGCEHPGDAARALWNATRQAAVVTCGADGCWYVGGDDPQVPRHQQAIRVTVVDTTGCGDVFHGAYAAALARGLDLPDRVRLASAAAALKATRRGGQAGIPTKAAVDRFLEEYRE